MVLWHLWRQSLRVSLPSALCLSVRIHNLPSKDQYKNINSIYSIHYALNIICMRTHTQWTLSEWGAHVFVKKDKLGLSVCYKSELGWEVCGVWMGRWSLEHGEQRQVYAEKMGSKTEHTGAEDKGRVPSQCSEPQSSMQGSKQCCTFSYTVCLWEVLSKGGLQ